MDLIRQKKIQVDNKINNDHQVYSDKEMIEAVIRNLISFFEIKASWISKARSEKDRVSLSGSLFSHTGRNIKREVGSFTRSRSYTDLSSQLFHDTFGDG